MSTTALKVVLDVNILVAIIGRNSPFRWIFDCIIDGELHCASRLKFFWNIGKFWSEKMGWKLQKTYST